MTTRRKLNTGDSLDYVIPLDTPITIGWAYLLTSNNMQHIHQDVGVFELTIPSDGSLSLSIAGGA